MASRWNRDDRPTMIHCDRCGEDYILEFAGGDVDEIMEKILE